MTPLTSVVAHLKEAIIIAHVVVNVIIGYTYYNYIEALGFTFIDGTPFGILED